MLVMNNSMTPTDIKIFAVIAVPIASGLLFHTAFRTDEMLEIPKVSRLGADDDKALGRYLQI